MSKVFWGFVSERAVLFSLDLNICFIQQVTEKIFNYPFLPAYLSTMSQESLLLTKKKKKTKPLILHYKPFPRRLWQPEMGRDKIQWPKRLLPIPWKWNSSTLYCRERQKFNRNRPCRVWMPSLKHLSCWMPSLKHLKGPPLPASGCCTHSGNSHLRVGTKKLRHPVLVTTFENNLPYYSIIK